MNRDPLSHHVDLQPTDTHPISRRRFFDPKKNSWISGAPVPRGANHIGVEALNGIVYAFGGFVEQNRIAIPDCYAYEVASDKWHPVRPLQIGSRGAVSLVAFQDRIHCI